MSLTAQELQTLNDSLSKSLLEKMNVLQNQATPASTPAAANSNAALMGITNRTGMDLARDIALGVSLVGTITLGTIAIVKAFSGDGGEMAAAK